jgi:hypothetical protein
MMPLLSAAALFTLAPPLAVMRRLLLSAILRVRAPVPVLRPSSFLSSPLFSFRRVLPLALCCIPPVFRWSCWVLCSNMSCRRSALRSHGSWCRGTTRSRLTHITARYYIDNDITYKIFIPSGERRGACGASPTPRVGPTYTKQSDPSRHTIAPAYGSPSRGSGACTCYDTGGARPRTAETCRCRPCRSRPASRSRRDVSVLTRISCVTRSTPSVLFLFQPTSLESPTLRIQSPRLTGLPTEGAVRAVLLNTVISLSACTGMAGLSLPIRRPAPNKSTRRIDRSAARSCSPAGTGARFR